jgi:hypothetical protein
MGNDMLMNQFRSNEESLPLFLSFGTLLMFSWNLRMLQTDKQRFINNTHYFGLCDVTYFFDSYHYFVMNQVLPDFYRNNKIIMEINDTK